MKTELKNEHAALPNAAFSVGAHQSSVFSDSNSEPDSATINDMSLRIYQTPVQHLPEDLYVPPQAFAIWLEQFAGPLDFLLYLVKKNNVDLTQMPILPITEQYLAYIGELDSEHFELAGDYLLMASTLICAYSSRRSISSAFGSRSSLGVSGFGSSSSVLMAIKVDAISK